MSYARFSDDSSVYVYLDCGGSLRCCGCSLEGRSGEWDYDTTDAILAHLQEHIHAGDRVPAYCIDGLKARREENDAYIAHIRAGGEEDAFVWPEVAGA